MFRYTFNVSRSKNYSFVVTTANKFTCHNIESNRHVVEFDVKELFEKWEHFNLMFWKSVDWKGTTFGYDGFDLCSHEDKTRMFYALQLSHTKWLRMSENFLRSLAEVYLRPDILPEVRKRMMSEEYVNMILDQINIAKSNNKKDTK